MPKAQALVGSRPGDPPPPPTQQPPSQSPPQLPPSQLAQVDPNDEAAEAAAIASVTTVELAEALAKVPSDIVEDMRNEARYLLELKANEDEIKRKRKISTDEWMRLYEKAKAAGGVETIPMLHPITGKPVFAYRRADDMLFVNPHDLRESLFEYFKMEKHEEDDVAVRSMQDIIEQVMKPEAADNDVFRDLCEKGTIPIEVAAASSTITPKSAYVAFKKPE